MPPSCPPACTKCRNPRSPALRPGLGCERCGALQPAFRAFSNPRMIMKELDDAESLTRMRRPRSGRLPFWGFGFEDRDPVVVVACAAWKSGKPGFGFPLFHPAHAGAVGMGKSRGVGEISKGRWEVWETGFWFSTLSTGPAFPQPWCGFTESAGEWATRSCTAGGAWPWRRSSFRRTRCRSSCQPTSPSVGR